jgi:hypothetical protein
LPPGLYHLTSITNLDDDKPYAGPFIGVYAETCPGASDSDLLKGDTVILNPDITDPIDLRSEPGDTGKIVGNMALDEPAQTIEDFRCIDQSVWWKVRTSSGMEGWTAEGRAEIRILNPVQSG